MPPLEHREEDDGDQNVRMCGSRAVSIVSWETPTRVGYHDLLNAMTAAGLPLTLVNPTIPKNAVARARQVMLRDGRRVISVAYEDAEKIVVQFTSEQPVGDVADSTIHLDYKKEDLLTVDKKTAAVFGARQDLVDRMRALIDQAIGNKCRGDITAMIKRYFRVGTSASGPSHLVPFTSAGYTYVVPHVAQNLEKLDRVGKLLDGIQGRLKRLVFDLSSQLNAAEVVSLLDGEITGRLRDLENEIAELSTAGNVSLLKARTDNVTVLSAYLQAMQGLLDDRAATIGQEVDRLRETLQHAIAEGHPAEAGNG